PGGTSDAEAWILSVLAKRSRLAFEFGTCTGKTAYLWARNMPSDGRVVTLTLPPERVSEYSRATGDDPVDVEFALAESRFTSFRYTGTEVEDRVAQLFADSKTFDESPYAGQCDLVFVDGSHAYSYVASDSRKALRMVRPGGLVLWHDYDGSRRHDIGVFRLLNELSRELPLVHVAGTTLVAYRRPEA
ncbi:MAG TPA: class I SAM-dependent methyltransferase, partial [Longimicrobiales bacterium]|nr:class I SAM-dependent methyltransferase [Longimicrobiales bacterium]